jgi:hypothetical protein
LLETAQNLPPKGDHALTGKAIGEMLGIAGDGTVITGPEIDKMTDVDLRQVVNGCNIYARASPGAVLFAACLQLAGWLFAVCLCVACLFVCLFCLPVCFLVCLLVCWLQLLCKHPKLLGKNNQYPFKTPQNNP